MEKLSREPKRAELFIWSSRAIKELERLKKRGENPVLVNGDTYEKEAVRRGASRKIDQRELAEPIREFGQLLKEAVSDSPSLNDEEFEHSLAILRARLSVFMRLSAILSKEDAPKVIPEMSQPD